MNAWKCTVCGKVIYSDHVPEQCPLCGVGSEFFEQIHSDHEEQHNEEQHNSDKQIIIVGGGIAALSAATTIRQYDHGCRIDLYTMEEYLPYERIRLTKELSASMTDEFLLHDAAWYEEQQIHYHLNEEVMNIHPDTHSIELVSGIQKQYDDLILAMGAHAYVPAIPGNDLNQIFTLRTLKDAREIMETAKKSRRCIIVGGGILGIELACALADQHLDVSIVENMPVLMAKQLDATASDYLLEYLKQQKIHVYLNHQVKAFHGVNRVESVELETGRCLDADFIVMSTGIRANLNLVKHTDLSYDRFLHVNERMETSLPHIYACGDVVSCAGIQDGLWSTAQKQGEVVAYNICGKQAEFHPVPQPMFFHHDQFSLFQIGNLHQMDQSKLYMDEAKNRYEAYAYTEGACSGVLLINAPSQIDHAWRTFIAKEKFTFPYTEMIEPL